MSDAYRKWIERNKYPHTRARALAFSYGHRIASAEAASRVAAIAAENAKLKEALKRLRDPAPGVKKLPPWAYGIIVPALT